MATQLHDPPIPATFGIASHIMNITDILQHMQITVYLYKVGRLLRPRFAVHYLCKKRT